jgi:hydroxybutyrate-dimer hydrolase
MVHHTGSTRLPLHRRRLLVTVILLAVFILVSSATVQSLPARAADLTQVGSPNLRPAFIVGDILSATYDGDSDDLLTAGLGQAGLQGAAPTLVDPANPTPAELRRLAIYNNYRAIVDVSPGSGYGTLYGPAVGPGATADGKIAGKEYIAFAGADDLVTMMVQIPANFDAAAPCIVTGPSSGSRGVYGAIGGVGEWALKRGCAVAYTDKGTGMGFHDLDNATVNAITGERVATNATAANFVAAFDSDWATANPGRIAVKHAHSQRNPEADWGRFVLESIEFAFYVLNLEENFGTPGAGDTTLRALVPENTIVIGAGVSNGGGASVRAAEQDTLGLIDGVAVSEPNLNPDPLAGLIIEQGDLRWTLPNHSRPLIDYYTFLNIYAPCAVRSETLADAPFNTVPAALGDARCASLAAKGLVAGDTVAEQSADALAQISAYGMIDEQLVLLPSHNAFFVFESIALLYTSSYGQFSVSDNVCGYSYAFTDPATFTPVAPNPTVLAAIFGTGNGIPPTGGINIINDNSLGGPALSRVSVSPAGALDQNLDGALCLRRLATGVDEAGEPLTGAELQQHQRVAAGAADVLAGGDLQGIPTIIVHGRADSVIPINYGARPYYGLNQSVEGDASKLRYYEILNAQHFDAFNGFPGFNTRYIPIHHYALEALDLLYAHLTEDAALPPSQVVATTPRAPGEAANTAEPITAENVPPIAAEPEPTNRIVYQAGDNLLRIGIFGRDYFFPLIGN